ncbi:protein arginine methyltransferase NDUFAF7, mitochondrial-like isoform X1 [Lytechinus variegatus]|uniref:protein arginine methyltransferase NDUFAF7, mitochondrial-like isoform X1 n=2 Tax=Lytechinus variegatus TaxID=7654 RepID=UPI001BB21727|nr:protein arginine methyltransferase NDUFAF7, mitochondrial-like isoform X1 [Lytechinus variegatus]
MLRSTILRQKIISICNFKNCILRCGNIRCSGSRLPHYPWRTASTRCHGSSAAVAKESIVMEGLKQRIRTLGPITVADYMKEVLTSPVGGYYMQGDVFGERGDFITSPEISQMFGELIALWIIHEWSRLGCPRPLQLVELGPGRGTLADDVLRVFKQFPQLPLDTLSLHLIEVSPGMSDVQHKTLTGHQRRLKDEVNGGVIDGIPYRSASIKGGIPVSWYTSLSQIPSGFTCFLAHEFFDALPIHKFQKSSSGWREIMIDVDDDSNSPQDLRFVLSPAPTPASNSFIQASETRDHVEVCPTAAVIVQEMAGRIYSDGGMALIVDYGHDGTKTDTFRGFKNHQLHDVLSEPGTADLTADVDFAYLRRMVGDRAATYGPIHQGLFLQMMGIDTRLKALLKSTPSEEHKNLISGYKMLTQPDQMGERFKFFSILPHLPNQYVPAGFR